METREAVRVRLVLIVVISVLMLHLSSGAAIRTLDATSPKEMSSQQEQQKTEVSTGAPLKISPENWSNVSMARVTNCSEIGGNDRFGALCDEQTLQKTNGTMEDIPVTGNEWPATNKTTSIKKQAMQVKKTVTTVPKESSKEIIEMALEMNDSVTQTLKTKQGTKTTVQTAPVFANETSKPYPQMEDAINTNNKTVNTTSTPTTEPVKDTNDSVEQNTKAVQGTTMTKQTTTTTNISMTTRQTMTETNKTVLQATIRSTASTMFDTHSAAIRVKTANSTQALTTETTGESVTTTRPAYTTPGPRAEMTAENTSPGKTTPDQNVPNFIESTPGNQHGTAKTTVTHSNEGSREGIAPEEGTAVPHENTFNVDTRMRNRSVLPPANARLDGLPPVDEAVTSTSPPTVQKNKEVQMKATARGGTRPIIYDQRYVILDAQPRMVIRGRY